MRAIYSFWIMEPPEVKALLFGLFVLALISSVRLVRLAFRLYWYADQSIFPDGVFGWDVDPDVLAASALGSLRVRQVLLGISAPLDPSKGRGGPEVDLKMLRMADTKFRYLWEKCDADVESARKASALALLLSFVVIAAGAPRAYAEHCLVGTLATCLALTAEQLLAVLTLELSLCAILYIGYSFFGRALADRQACWKYLYTRWHNEYTRE